MAVGIAALGITPKTSLAVLVTIAGPAEAVRLLGRRRIELVGDVREVPALPTVLRSHPLLHVAEGQLARETWSEAAAAAGLAVHYLAPKGPRNPVHTATATEMRREIEPPSGDTTGGCGTGPSARRSVRSPG